MDSLGQFAFPAMALTLGAFLVLGVVAVAWRRPTTFVVQPRVPAFSTQPEPARPLLALAFLTLATGMAGNVIRHWGSERFLADPLLDLGFVAVALLHIAVAWRDQSVQLEDIDPRLIAAAVRYYVAHPEHRPAIGTRAEYDRLMPQLLD